MRLLLFCCGVLLSFGQNAWAKEKKTATKPIFAYEVTKKVADLLNSEQGIMYKQMTEWEKGLSKDDLAYLKTIAYKPMLPKGYIALPLDNGLVVIHDNKTISAIRITELTPLKLQKANGKIIQMDGKDLVKSISQNDFSGKSQGFFARAAASLIANAWADEQASAIQEKLDKQTAFLFGLSFSQNKLKMEQKWAAQDKETGTSRPGIARATRYQDFLKNFLAGTGANATVNCKKTPAGSGYALIQLERDGVRSNIYKSDYHRLQGGQAGAMPDRDYFWSYDVPGRVAAGKNGKDKEYFEKNLEEAHTRLVSKMASDLNVNQSVGEILINDDTKSCTIVFANSRIALSAELQKLRDDVVNYCKDSSKPAVSAYLKAHEENSKVAALNKYVDDNYYPLEMLSRAVQDCCSDNNCRLEAIDNGINLDKGIKVESGAAPKGAQ